jgi:phosphomannomutase/phosphoglucomutase
MLLYTFRGIANKDLTCEVATKIAVIEGQHLKELENAQKILIAGDHRVSTPMLKSALTAGFLSVGLNVIDCGMLPTPILSFIVKKLSLPGVMVTASHNPPEWNGFQFLEPDSHIYGPDKEERIKSMLNEKLQFPDWQGIGSTSERESCIDEYIAQLLKTIKVEKSIKVVVDFGGGMAAVVVPKLLECMGVEFVEINSELDPFFKERPSEPSAEVIGELLKQVIKEKADAGFAYDGDADRVMVVDEKGDIVEGDKLIFLLCKEMLKPPGPVVLTADISMAVEKTLKDRGFEIIRNRWGQTFIGDTVRKSNAELGAETNDHYMFPELSLHADGIAATAFLCSILSRNEKKLSLQFDELPKTYIYREKVNFTNDLTYHSANIESFFNQHFGNFEKLHARLYLASVDESKLLLRQSPFDEYVRIFAESFHPQKTEEMVKQMKGVLGIT